LLELPPELRNLIYDLVIENEPVWGITVAQEGKLADTQSAELPLKLLCPLARTCRQIRNDIRPMVQARSASLQWVTTTWNRQLYTEAAKLSVELTAPDQSWKERPLKVKFGFFPETIRMFALFEKPSKGPEVAVTALRDMIASCMTNFLNKHGTTTANGDTDSEHLAELLRGQLALSSGWVLRSTK